MLHDLDTRCKNPNCVPCNIRKELFELKSILSEVEK